MAHTDGIACGGNARFNRFRGAPALSALHGSAPRNRANLFQSSKPFSILRQPRFLRCVFTGDCVLTPLRGRLAASRRGSQAPDHTCLKYPTGSPESVLAAVFIPRCGQSVAAAVGESHTLWMAVREGRPPAE